MDTRLSLSAVIAVIAAFSISSCSPNARTSMRAKAYAHSDGDQFEEYEDNGDPDPLPTYSPAPTPSPSYTPVGLPPVTMRVDGIGYSEISVEISAGRKLRLKFTPGLQDKTIAGTGFSPLYSKLGVHVTVGDQTQPTPMLSNGFMSGNAESSPIMDFSAVIAPNCPVSEPGCRQDVTITLSKPNNDYWCGTWGMYCPWAQMHPTHPWNGTLTIETDDTDPLESSGTD